MRETVLVLDFGGCAKDIARSVREAGVFSVIKPGTAAVKSIADVKPVGVIISAAGNNPGTDNSLFQGLPSTTLYDGEDLSGQIRDFLYSDCKAKGDYNVEAYLKEQVEAVRNQVGSRRVLLALSGGVDSSVCAALLSQAIPGQTTCVFVDHGLMRMNEGDEVEAVFKKMNVTLIRVNAEERFLARLKGVTDPEAKRKIVGGEFIEVFREEAKKLGDIPLLAQGTIYADIVESGGDGAKLVKSHHNVGGLPKDMGFKDLVEPLSMLFKDEVRAFGLRLGLPKHLINRQPFPGPGLSVRVIGEVTKQKLDTLRHADAIFRQEVSRLRRRPDQYFAVHTGLNAVGVTNGQRSYGTVIALRAVHSEDFMTAKYAELSHKTLSKATSRILAEVPGVGRVVYDITSKPPGTVEWE